jgi:hypothetical protein
MNFSGALNSGDASNLAAYMLASAKRKKKATVYTNSVPLTSATYNAAAETVTLMLRGKLPRRAIQLTINAADVMDAEGRQLDGNGDGQPGGNFVAILNSGRISSMAQSAAEVRVRRVAAAIDALVDDRSFRITRSEHGYRQGAR